MHRYTLQPLLAILLLCSSAYAQKIPKPEAMNRVILHKVDTTYIFYAFTKPQGNKAKSLNESKKYYWYSAGGDNILSTLGAYSGRVLHGKYEVLYPGGNIKERGSFDNGLKTGTWQTWYPCGKPENIQNWKDGEKEGECRQYDDQGKLTKEYNFHNGLLSGYQTDYINDTTVQKTLYKNGKLMPQTEKHLKDSTQTKE